MILRVKKRYFYFICLLLSLMALSTLGYAALTTQTFTVAVTTADNAPRVYNVTPAAVTPVSQNHRASLTIEFNVTDADGVADLVNSGARVNVSLGGVTRTNDTGNCEVVTSSFNGGTDRTYRCVVPIRYHDNASSLWTINATINDTAGNVAANYSQTATVNSLSALSMVSADIALSGSLGSTNNELTFILNNTGNFNFTKLNLTPYDLNASVTDFFKLGGETTRGTANFSFNTTSSGSGFGIGLLNATPINISKNYGSGNTGLAVHLSPASGQNTDIEYANRTFYIYIDIPNDKGLSSGVTYNTSPALPWQIIADVVE
jgi:hypothetical protein